MRLPPVPGEKEGVRERIRRHRKKRKGEKGDGGFRRRATAGARGESQRDGELKVEI